MLFSFVSSNYELFLNHGSEHLQIVRNHDWLKIMYRQQNFLRQMSGYL